MWVHRRSEEPSCTEVTCYWNKSVLSGVGTNTKFMLATEMATAPEKSINLPDNSSFLMDVVNQLNKNQVDTQLSRYSFDLAVRDVYRLSLHQLLLLYSLEDKCSADNFIIFAKKKIDADLCVKAEIETRQQSESLLWYELRYGRITASKLHEAARCKTADGSLVKQIIGAAKVYETTSMKRGKILEHQVFEELEKKGYKINKCGFTIIQAHPIFGASPDGVGKDFIVEIKCPISEETFENYIHEGRITSKFEAQMQLQMLATGHKKGLFCVADWKFESNRKTNIYWIHYDQILINSLIENATRFWKQNVYPILAKSVDISPSTNTNNVQISPPTNNVHIE